jgi:tetratricopeptide (TPR) repeat protein
MTAATDMHRLSDETLAAYLDGKLNDAARDSVVEHLASCDECRSKAIEVSRTLEIFDQEYKLVAASPEGESDELADPEPVSPDDPPNVVTLEPEPKNRWMVSALAAAAVIAFVVPGIWKSFFHVPGIPELVAVNKELKERKTFGRLSGGFPFNVKPTRFRSANDTPTVEIKPEDGAIWEIRSDLQNARRQDPHALAISMLMLGERTEAINLLSSHLSKNPENDAVAQDLAVALLDRGTSADLKRSLEISNKLWAKAKTPEVAWNRAYALQYLGHLDDAVTAWNEYLKLDPSSSWTKEAIENRDEVQADLELERNP